ncbi:MAG: DUF6090 family protein [Bacteroidota bacterium]
MSKKPILDWRYAIGEIIIVIISISIAFGLNNWASARKDRQKAEQYLENLQEDLLSDRAALQTIDLRLDTALQQHWGISRHFFATIPGRDTVAFAFFKQLNRPYDFFPHNATFESLRYSGDFELIKGIDLKNKIVEHYGKYAVIEKNLSTYERTQFDYSFRFFHENLDYSKLQQTKGLDMLKNPKFSNLVFSNIGLLGRMQDGVQASIQRCDSLIHQIKLEL